MSSKMGTVNLTKETIIQLQTLALPGESMSSVIQRAVLALQTLESNSVQDRVMQRLDALTSQLDRIERSCNAYQPGREAGDERGQRPDFEPSTCISPQNPV